MSTCYSSAEFNWLTFGAEVLTCLVREHTDFLKNGADRSTPLSPSGEGNNAVAAHVVTASHDGPAEADSVLVQVK